MPFPGEADGAVKAVSPAPRGRSGAESLDGPAASRRIGNVMPRVWSGEGLDVARVILQTGY